MAHKPGYYEILQVSPDAEREVIEAAYRRLARKYHPDVNRDPTAGERMQRLNEAFEVLSDPHQRAEYDSARDKFGDTSSNEDQGTGRAPGPPKQGNRIIPSRWK